MTLRERIREARRRAVAAATKTIEGTHERARRHDWALSRERAGWSKPLVDDAISAGPLSVVRTAIQDPPAHLPPRLERAMKALGTIDSGRQLEPSAPHYGDDTPPLQRRTYAPARLRAV